MLLPVCEGGEEVPGQWRWIELTKGFQCDGYRSERDGTHRHQWICCYSGNTASYGATDAFHDCIGRHCCYFFSL